MKFSSENLSFVELLTLGPIWKTKNLWTSGGYSEKQCFYETLSSWGNNCFVNSHSRIRDLTESKIEAFSLHSLLLAVPNCY
jgi:hypothetical protein